MQDLLSRRTTETGGSPFHSRKNEKNRFVEETFLSLLRCISPYFVQLRKKGDLWKANSRGHPYLVFTSLLKWAVQSNQGGKYLHCFQTSNGGCVGTPHKGKSPCNCLAEKGEGEETRSKATLLQRKLRAPFLFNCQSLTDKGRRRREEGGKKEGGEKEGGRLEAFSISLQGTKQ